jgi:hypothetical protein
MKKWHFLLRPETGLIFWYIFNAADNIVCRSLRGFTTEAEARSDLADYHPPDHF